MDEVVNEFLVESRENLDQLDQALIELERDPQHKESLNNIFRTIHTIKGTCGFLGFGKLQRVTHVGENLLSRLREGQLVLNEPITNGLLAMVDAVRQVLGTIENTSQEGDEDYSGLVTKLTRLAEGQTEAPEPPPAQPAPLASASPPAPRPPAPPSPPAKPAEAAPTLPAIPAPAPPSTAAKDEQRTAGISDGTIRVGVNLLDKLMNLVGELVLIRNEILELTNARPDPLAQRAGQRLNLITTELQESVMKTRLQPIDQVWGKLPRMVRDVTTELGKRVRLEISGHDTELDRSVLETIKDPLTHLIRNSIDHGIEKPEKRAALGKPEEGLLQLRAFHEGGQVNIEIADDGAGIDLERVKKKALEQSLITSEQAGQMTDRETLQLIFRPGFSTAESVTNLSGRGVGMDVVKANIKRIGGTVDLSTEKGRGTTIKIKIPLTLVIIPALIVTTCGERFAIPQMSLLELVRLEGEQARKGIESVFGSPVYRLRGKLLPLVYLRQILHLDQNQAAGPGGKNGASEAKANIAVLQSDGQTFGLVVDEVNDTQEIVVKPLGKHLKGIPVFAGATIMGDGRLALILDVLGLAYSAHVVTQARDLRVLQQVRENQTGRAAATQRLLICTVGRSHRVALPLASVWRLERFPRSALEREGDGEVVQYRGQILPLVPLAKLWPQEEAELASSPDFPVIIYSEPGRRVGLVVSQIVDVVEQLEPPEKRSGRPGVSGASIIQGRVTELLDVPALLSSLERPALAPV